MATGYVTSNLLPLEAVKLGRLVLDPKRPQKDFFDPFDSGPTASEVARNEQSNFQETRKFSKRFNTRSRTSSVFAISYESGNAGLGTLSAPHAVSYDLLNPAAWFNKACTQEPTRRFLESAIDDASNIYLIIGFRTVQDINPADELNRENSKEKLAAANTEPSPTLIIDHTQNLGNEPKSSIPGEQIFAIIYQKVRFNWLSNMYVDNMTMEENNRWVSCWAWRGAYENESEDDILEAELTDLGDLDFSDEEVDSGIEVADFTDNPSSTPSTGGAI